MSFIRQANSEMLSETQMIFTYHKMKKIQDKYTKEKKKHIENLVFSILN